LGACGAREGKYRARREQDSDTAATDTQYCHLRFIITLR
jgi:hypothetical protein